MLGYIIHEFYLSTTIPRTRWYYGENVNKELMVLCLPLKTMGRPTVFWVYFDLLGADWSIQTCFRNWQISSLQSYKLLVVDQKCHMMAINFLHYMIHNSGMEYNGLCFQKITLTLFQTNTILMIFCI